MENNQKALQTSGLAVDGAPSLQSSISTNGCSLVDSVGSLPVPMPGHLNNESNGVEVNNDRCEEPLASVEAVHVHEMDGKVEIDNPCNNHESSNCAPSDQTTLQVHCIEGNLLSCKLVGCDSLDNTGTTSFCHQEETQMEQSPVASETRITEIVDGKKVDIRLACFSSSENNRACHEDELVEDMDEPVSTVLTKACSREIGKLGEDEITKARPRDPITEEASNEAHAGDKETFLNTVNADTSSSDFCCHEEHGSQIFYSGSPAIITESNVIDDQDSLHMAASDPACIVSQGLLSEPVKEIEKEGNVGSSAFCAPDGNGASETSIHGSQDANACIQENATKNVDENCSSLFQNEIKTIAVAEETTEPVTRDDCNAGNENTLDQKCLPGLNEDSTLEDRFASEIIISIGEGSKESIVEDASYDDEDSISALPLPATSSMISQTRSIEQETLNAQCSVDDTHIGTNVGNTSSQVEDGAASSQCQHHGCTIDKDGGSSLDSTAGTGPQQSDGCVPVEDEEASSTGGEDTASSPACVQPLRQQRKKINIHHQFVREIVKIQHDREQFDREQAGRQIHTQQAATLPQVGRKSSDIKKNTFSESREIRGETSNPKGLKDVGTHRQSKDAQQKHSTKNKKSLVIQSRNESAHQWNSPRESNEQSRQQAFSHAMGAKETDKIGRGKQQPSMSIYRPPVVRESLMAEHRNLGEPETFNRQSGAYAMSSSPNNSASSFTEACAPIAGLPHFMNVEGSPKMVRSSSGECFADSLETHADQSAPGMGIKVTFDTERRQRHIQFSDGLHSFSKREQASPAASHSSAGYRANMDSKFNPSSQSFQDSKFSSGSWQQIDYDETPFKGNDRHATQAARSANSVHNRTFQDSSFALGSRQIDLGERPSKGNDRHFIQAAGSVNPSHRHPFQDTKSISGSGKNDHSETPSKGNDHHFMQAARSGSLHGFVSAEPSQTRVRAGKSSGKPTEKKSSFFERADNSANLHNLSAQLQKSSPVIRQGNDGQSYCSNSTRGSDWYAEKTPSPSSQSFNTPSSQRTALMGPTFERGFFGLTSFASANVRSEESERTAMNMQGNIQHQLFHTPRSHDLRGNLKYAVTTDNGRGKRDSQHKNSTKDFSSPFQAMMKDTRPQAVFSAPAQRSSDASQDSRGFGMSWHAKEQTQTHSSEILQESLRRIQSDASRKAFTQNSQAQLASSPLTESLFCTMPMQEKWGDIVDDLTDSYDYLQIKSDGGERETHSGSLLYGASNQSIPSFSDAKASKPVFRDSKQDRGMPKYNYRETNSSQKHTEVVRERLAYDTPARKSVFERLGPQNNFQESILGPPPKMFDSRGVLKASPDALLSNAPPVSTFKGFDTGLYGTQWASQPSSMQHENADDEGREVVVQAYTEVKQRRSKRELYVPRRGS
ncbi:hypothetical protein GOP47_0023722 [Adiantum capillus-veneris]|uniref:Uncharacterized protein n=1 Tax=Adiantum capillus-veneris TaxID=13818 RepID=A0A9D4U4F4_ADICA|nr:hypothetical protein GOP47_0023722 [Adiantum capillus-veneris]